MVEILLFLFMVSVDHQELKEFANKNNIHGSIEIGGSYGTGSSYGGSCDEPDNEFNSLCVDNRKWIARRIDKAADAAHSHANTLGPQGISGRAGHWFYKRDSDVLRKGVKVDFKKVNRVLNWFYNIHKKGYIMTAKRVPLYWEHHEITFAELEYMTRLLKAELNNKERKWYFGHRISIWKTWEYPYTRF